MIYHNLHSRYRVTEFKSEKLHLGTGTFYSTKRCTPDLGN